MAEPVTSAPGDEVLTAYLDGELPAEERRALEAQLAADASLKGRLDALAKGSRPFKEAFAPLLEAAPRERLEAMIRRTTPRPQMPAPRRGWVAAAAAVVLFAAGIAIGMVARGPAPTIVAGGTPPSAPAAGDQAAPNWRQVVAEYLVLTTPATLAAAPDNPNLGMAIANYAKSLKLDVSTDKLMLPMQALKDVEFYDFRGKPLIEAAYLSKDATMTVAFCIILNGGADAPIAFEQREGQNIVFWSQGGHGYMVVGTLPREQLEAMAKNLQARFS
jgi:anti-sigma factor RsiW